MNLRQRLLLIEAKLTPKKRPGIVICHLHDRASKVEAYSKAHDGKSPGKVMGIISCNSLLKKLKFLINENTSKQTEKEKPP